MLQDGKSASHQQAWSNHPAGRREACELQQEQLLLDLPGASLALPEAAPEGVQRLTGFDRQVWLGRLITCRTS